MKSEGSPLTLFRMTTRNLVRRPMRTSLTALGVALGVTAIVAFTTLAQGMWHAVDTLVRVNDADLMVFQANVAADIFSKLDEDTIGADLMATPGVHNTIALLWHILPVEGQPFIFVFGVQLDELGYVTEGLVRGRDPHTDDEVMLGVVTQRILGKDVGDTVLIQGQPYRVVGLFRTEVVFINSAILFSLPRLQQITGNEGLVTSFQVFVDPDAEVELVAERIEREHPELVAIADASEYNKVDQGLEIMKGMVWAVSFMALVIGGIIVANTMWMSVLERTREIGVLRAVGWSRRRIVSLILLEATGVGLIACLLGCVFGVGLAELGTYLQTAEQFLDPVFGVMPFLLALSVAVLLSVLGALLPAWRAARISPAEALRYE